MTKAKAKVKSWPRDRLEPSKCYRAEKAGIIYELSPSKDHPGYWQASKLTKRNCRLKTFKPLPEDALFDLFYAGVFRWGLELVAVNDRESKAADAAVKQLQQFVSRGQAAQKAVDEIILSSAEQRNNNQRKQTK